MSRIRSLHPGLFTDEAFMSASMPARVLLFGIWTECDDNGVFEWKPIRLKMRILPADNFEVAPLLDELARLNLIKKFDDDDGRALGGVRNFCKWQRPKSPQSIYPCSDELATYTAIAARVMADEKPERGTALGKLLLERQGGRCHYCGTTLTFYRKKPNSLEIDHRVPVSRSGSDDITNLVATCRPCNSLKANLTDDEFRDKFAPSELQSRHRSLFPKMFSDDANEVSGTANALSAPPKTGSPTPKNVSGEIRPQMEDGGWRMEDGKEVAESSETPTVAPEPAASDQPACSEKPDEPRPNGRAGLPKARWPADRAVPMEWVAQTAEQYPRADGYEEAENFRRYWSEGKGKNTARDDVGWRRSWQTWIERSRPGSPDWRDRFGYDRLLHGKHGAPH